MRRCLLLVALLCLSRGVAAQVAYQGCWTNAVNETRALSFKAAANSFMTVDYCRCLPFPVWGPLAHIPHLHMQQLQLLSLNICQSREIFSSRALHATNRCQMFSAHICPLLLCSAGA